MVLGEGVQIVRGVLNLEETRGFYERLGYIKLDESDKPNKWVLYTDGRINLLLDEGEMKYTGLIYFNPNFKKDIPKLKKLGVKFQKMIPKSEFIPEAAIFMDPEDFGVNIVNSPYEMKNKPELMGPSKVRFGKFGEFASSVKNLDVVVEFWEKLGYNVLLKESEPQPWAILADGLMVLGLHQEDWGPDSNEPALTYFHPEMETIYPLLQKDGIKIEEFNGESIDTGNGFVRAPDGLRILLFKGEIP